MAIGRQTRYFRIFIVATVTVLLIMLNTKERIMQMLASEQQFNNDPKIRLTKQNKENINVNTIKNLDETKEKEQISEDIDYQPEKSDEIREPFNDKMPAAYLRFKIPTETNQSYCKYNYGLPYDLLFGKNLSNITPEQGNNTSYRVLYNVTEAYNTEKVVQITYASHMTANFAYFIPELLSRWDGLIVITAFVPDLDAALFLEQINQFCYCEPEMYRVSIHLVTHKTVLFSKKGIYFDRPKNCIPHDSSKVPIFQEYDDTILYPVNVLRNVAKMSALTEYFLLSDIELMPSEGLSSKFLNMIQNKNAVNQKEVFVLPIFEVEENETIPENKEKLLYLIKEKKAVYFHEMVCKHCQKFPGIERWYKSGFSSQIEPLVTVKRRKPYHRWEPIFIGTRKEPLYSENLSWEGLQDKMSQSAEMCLQDYNYTILDNAFLCHWPGMKTQKLEFEEWRVDHVERNKMFYKEIIGNLLKTYTDIPDCMASDFSAKLPSRKEETTKITAKSQWQSKPRTYKIIGLP